MTTNLTINFGATSQMFTVEGGRLSSTICVKDDFMADLPLSIDDIRQIKRLHCSLVEGGVNKAEVTMTKEANGLLLKQITF